MPIIEFGETINESADQLLNSEVVSDISKAREFLRRALPPGQTAKARDIIEQAKKEGLSIDTLRRARRDMGREFQQGWRERESIWGHTPL